MEHHRKSSPRVAENVRMAGFLEKKGKMKLMSQWKKYWFVLEEKLLLYYRSEIEYTNLSPCRGSLDMGLVSTVRPGSSSGPCIIHVITRTQVVQLRAKNRATQEEWLQALLHSMSLPLVTKALQTPTKKNAHLGYGSSLDNIARNDRLKNGDSEKEWTLPRKLDYRRRQISGTIYGGSLDTAIWSKKFRPLRTPSPSVPKGKVLEKILGLTSKENEALAIVGIRQKNSRLSLCNEEEMKYVGESDEVGGSEVRCKVHDENRNHDLYSTVDKRKKKMKKTFSDTELNKKPQIPSLEYIKAERKDESPLERIKNVLSRTPKDKKSTPDVEKRNRLSKKRRRSFLQKVFKKKEYESGGDNESTISNPLYDTIDNIQEEAQSLVCFRQQTPSDQADESTEDPMYTQVQKPVTGSKTILPPSTMSELKIKLKSRESLEKQDMKFIEDENEEVERSFRRERNRCKNAESSAPPLPPRRVSRPISPWHDVPTNNTPVSSNKTSFFVHQAIVKFNDPVQVEIQMTDNEFSDFEDNLRVDLSETNKRNSIGDLKKVETFERRKNDDLSVLLDQLTKISVAPLAEPEVNDDNYSSESEKLWTKSQFSDPDYDIPRPHRPLSILISQESEIISSTEFMGRFDNHSDTGSSFQSMEPDSLEMAEKKYIHA